MTLRKKTILITGITLLCLIVVLYVITSTIFLKSFLRLEEDDVRKNMERITGVLSDDLTALSSAVGDWAAWDESYAFIKNTDMAFVRKNLPDETYSELKLNLILFVDLSGRVVFGRGFDLKNRHETAIPEDIYRHLSSDSILLKHGDAQSSVHGIILLKDAPLLFASRPILTSERKGPIRGSIIFGRYLDDIEIERLSKLTKLSISVYPVNALEKLPDFKDVSSRMKSGIVVKPIDDHIVTGYAMVNDIYDKPALLLKADIPRDIYRQGKITLNYFVLAIMLSGIIFGVMILALLEKSVISRLSVLSKKIKGMTIESVPIYSEKIGNDELSNLSMDILESITRSRYILYTMIEHLPEGVFLMNSDHRIVLANQIGMEHLRLLSNAGVGDILTHIAGRPVEEMIVSSSDMAWHTIESNGRIFECAGRRILKDNSTGIVFVTSDVTKEKRFLEFIQTQERLAAIGQLAAGIAHDFNNILTGITGYAQIYQSDESLPNNVRHALNVILKNGERAAELVRQILDFSRKSFSNFETIEMRSFIEECLVFIRRTIPENIKIKFDFELDRYMVRVDRTKIQQVLINLAVNAKDAMINGGELSFGLYRASFKEGERTPMDIIPPGNWVVMTVSDTGIGIPENVMPHIFEPFYTTKEVGKGTGLGLSQVYGIIKQHKGYIDVVSEQGKGTTFFIFLPEVSKTNHASLLSKDLLVSLERGKGETILVVEDDPLVRDFVRNALESYGYSVIISKDGEDALKTFENSNNYIDLVITDIVMPGIDGLHLSRLLKGMNPSVKIIAISGYPLKANINLMQSEIAEWIEKPVNVQTLIRKVQDVLYERG